MANRTLVVNVVSAYDLSGSLDLLNPCVELRFAGQTYTTSPKRDSCPVWNERTTFSVPDRRSLTSLTLEAYVCNVIENSKYVLGKVRVDGSYFTVDSGVPKAYQLKGPIFQRSKGKLILEVFVSNEAPVASSEAFPDVIPFRSLRQAVQEGPRQPAEVSALKKIEQKFEHGSIVKHMPCIFVRVVKARNLPDTKAGGRLDPRVEVKVGNYKGVTTCVLSEQNPEWNTVFVFSELRDQLTRVVVVVKDVDVVKDETVGMVFFDATDCTDVTPVAHWYRLVDKRDNPTEGELMLAVWKGSQFDEAFPDALKWDSKFHLGTSMLPHFRTKAYDVPSLWYVRVNVVEFRCIAVVTEVETVEMYATAAVGGQVLRTRKLEKKLDRYVWNEEMMFVTAEPFEDDLQISVKVPRGPEADHVVGRIAVPLDTFQKRLGVKDPPLATRTFNLHQIPPEIEAVDGGVNFTVSSCRILIRGCLEGGYNVRFDSFDYNGDLRPAAKQIPDPPVVGKLEIGILKADNLPPRKRRSGKTMLHPYCVAKYGRKWQRTRTIYDSCNPVFNEQYEWEVYDTSTVITIGVFDNAEIDGYSSEENKAVHIGKVRIPLSTLQPGQTFVHSYPLLVLTPSGIEEKGELHLAVRFSRKSLARMLRMYSSPMLPMMHYEHRLSMVEEERLQFQAVKLVASHMSRMEPALRREVVEYMCDSGSKLWSLRKSKSSFFRVMTIISGLVALCKWFEDVRSWKYPPTTLLVWAVFFLALVYHEVVLPAVLLYLFFITVWNYRWRPTCPQHVNTRISYVDVAHPDELDEEFDTFPTSQNPDLVRMRYDRLRHVASRVQTVMEDLASYGERIQSLASWRDTTATAIFSLFTLSAAILLYFTPWKVLVAIAGIYTMSPPTLRRKTPSYLWNFYMRLPKKTYSLI